MVRGSFFYGKEKTITQLQLYRKINSLVWRRYLLEIFEQLESEIIDYMNEKSTSKVVIAGFSVILSGENLEVEKLPIIDLNQLELNFTER